MYSLILHIESTNGNRNGSPNEERKSIGTLEDGSFLLYPTLFDLHKKENLKSVRPICI